MNTIKAPVFNLGYIIFLALVSALGGLLFGYDWVVIGGAKPFYELYFSISNNPTLQGWAMSSALLGCIAGSIVSGLFSNRYGRKSLLIFAAVLFMISAWGCGYVDSIEPFIAYRILGGIGIGIASTLSPMYIAEISPAKYRGRLVTLNQLTIVIGILAAQIANWIIADTIPDSYSSQEVLASWNGQQGWRWMFWAELIPAFGFFTLMFLVPKSPRFLSITGKDKEALLVLTKIGGRAYAQNELENIRLVSKHKQVEKASVKVLLHPKFRAVLLLGIVLAVFQQFCGINIIFNYSEEIFTAAGYSVGDLLFNIIVTGSVNLVFTFVSIRTVDRWGRRKLMLFGSAGLTLVYALLGAAYFFEFNGLLVLLLVVIAIAVYAMSLAPITWVILSEIFPNHIRGLAMSVATFTLWSAAFLVTFFFPILKNNLGSFGIFWLYSLICFIGYMFIKRKLPETKGKSLEEIEKEILA